MLFIERQKKCLNYLVRGPGAQKNFSVLESHTAWILFKSYLGLSIRQIKLFKKLTDKTYSCP